MKALIALILGLISMVVPVQVAAIHRLRDQVGSTPFAVGAALAVGTAALLLFSATGLLGKVQLRQLTEAPWWVWTAGLMLGSLMVAQTIGLSAAGAGAAMAATVCGQLVAGLIVDHFGWMGVQRVALDGWRVSGALLVILGAVAMQHR